MCAVLFPEDTYETLFVAVMALEFSHRHLIYELRKDSASRAQNQIYLNYAGRSLSERKSLSLQR